MRTIVFFSVQASRDKFLFRDTFTFGHHGPVSSYFVGKWKYKRLELNKDVVNTVRDERKHVPGKEHLASLVSSARQR